jgi:hypothetical protein
MIVRPSSRRDHEDILFTHALDLAVHLLPVSVARA